MIIAVVVAAVALPLRLSRRGPVSVSGRWTLVDGYSASKIHLKPKITSNLKPRPLQKARVNPRFTPATLGGKFSIYKKHVQLNKY